MHRRNPRRVGHRLSRRALINHTSRRTELWFKEYVLRVLRTPPRSSTNRFQDTEELDGVFSGFDPKNPANTIPSEGHWGYEKFPEQQAEETLQKMRIGRGRRRGRGRSSRPNIKKAKRAFTAPASMGGASAHNVATQFSVHQSPRPVGSRPATRPCKTRTA